MMAEGKTVGIYQDKRIGNLTGTVDTLTNAGWQVTWIGGKELASESKLADFDVLIFAGGFNRYFFANADQRRAVVRYAAKGGGVLLAGFRGGYVRSANRPMFPEIAAVHNRLSSPWLDPVGDSILAKAFCGRPLPAGAGDHLVLKMGEKGRVFAANSGDPVGAYGDFHCGRVIVYGAHLSYSPGDDSSEMNGRLVSAMMTYLADAKKPSESAAAKAADEAESDFIRRERIMDLALDERGPDRKAGVIPVQRDWFTAETESLACKLDYFAGFLAKGDAARCERTSSSLKANAGAIRAAADRLKADAVAELGRMSVSELRAFKVEGSPYDRAHVSARFGSLFASNEVSAAVTLVAELGPKVRATKAAALKGEIEADLKTVPALIGRLGAKSPETRREAVTELGRIAPDDEKAVKALVRAMDDKDSQVAVQAMISLGWMQAKGAVPALIERAGSADVRFRRRAVQILGQIGDARAVDTVLRAFDDGDGMVRCLAIIAAGHLKAKEAVARLVEKMKDEKLELDERECAILALGFIGERSVVPELERIRADVSGRPRTRRAKGRPLVNPYSFGRLAIPDWHIGLSWAAERALKDIAAGGRAETGVRQLEECRSKESFYAITRECNALAGRVKEGTGAFDGRLSLLVPILREAGFTGIHNAWGMPDVDPDDYEAFVAEAGEMGMVIIDALPGYANVGIAETEFRFARFGRLPAYRGFWAEETWPEPGLPDGSFASMAERLYGKDWRKLLRKDELAVAEEHVAKRDYMSFENVVQGDRKGEDNYAAPWDSSLRTMMLEAEGQRVTDLWTESQDYLHTRRKGFANTFVVSTADPVRYPRDNRQIHALDSIGHESYQSFGRSTSYFMRRYRDGEAHSAMSELYNWYCPSGEHACRGFWQSAIHSKCFFNFALYHIFRHASDEYLWVWDADRWDRFREVFQRVRANREYYRVSPTAANVAVLFSARTASVVRDNSYSQCAVPQRNDQDAMAAWVALGESQIPADVLYADGVSVEKLSRYDVLVLSDARFLGDEEIGSIRAWVKAGGVLVAQGTASLFDGFTLKPRGDYALADVFGVSYVGTDYLKDEESDTFSCRRGVSNRYFKFVPGLDSRYHFQDSVHRDLKPAKSVRTATFAEGCEALLVGMKAGDGIEIDAALGVDRVKPGSAKVVAAFEDGRPAILANEFGAGRVYFFTPNYPMLGHVTSEWEMMPNKWAFWRNVRETLAGMVRSGLAKKGAVLPVEVTGVGPDVEVTVDRQRERLVVHLLDYDVKNAKVEGAKLAIPGERAVKRVFYPDTKTELKIAGRTVALRDFAAYDMLVIEF